jgi:hypothetical protein
VAGAVQPRSGPTVKASSNAVNASASTPAPARSSRRTDRTVPSGTWRATSHSAPTAVAAPSANSQRQEAWSTIRPPATSPIPAPAPSTPEVTPTPSATRSAGNASRRIPNPSGSTARLMPWTARNPTSAPRFHASIAPSVPTR